MAARCLGRTLAQQAALALGTCLVATAAACSGEPLLPAYAHNDYLIDRPLVDALALGYRGVEADVFLVDGVEEPGAVQVVLVGWHPPLAELAVESPRYAAVQCRYRDLPADHEDLPAHLLKMVSVRYGDEFEWSGSDGVPSEFRCRLRGIRDRAGAVPGRILRVFHAPRRSRIYMELLAGGIDLVGSRHLERDRRLLAKALERLPDGNAR